MKILSIDWDYFVNASCSERYELFPDGGNEEMSQELKDLIWRYRYFTPELLKIGYLENEVKALRRVLRKSIKNSPKIMICNSHKNIYKFITEESQELSNVMVYNIDFHHDRYNFGSGVNCGNWARLLVESGVGYEWIAREDSETEGYKTYRMGELTDKMFDRIFLCKSDMWSPPHLDTKFINLARWVIKTFEDSEILAEYRILKPRKGYELKPSSNDIVTGLMNLRRDMGV